MEATRLSVLADGGQILATQVVEILAGRNAPHRFVPMGELELKGLPDPVPSVAVAWEPDESTDVEGGQLPLPPRLESASAGRTFAFSGRTEELAAFAQAGRTTVRQRQLGVVLVAGEPGIGKTTLVAQGARAVPSRCAPQALGHLPPAVNNGDRWFRGVKHQRNTFKRLPELCPGSPGTKESRIARTHT